MASPGFENLSDWKDFERLCADLLAAEGLIVESEPFVDRTGTDIVAVEEYRSHDPSRVIRVRWRVQCKHYAGSGNNLGRKEVEESLYNFEINKKTGEGLFLIVDTDYSESAKKVIDNYVSQRPDAKVTLWNQRQLATRLERHPHLLTRYGLSLPKSDYVSALGSLRKLGPARTLLISDQSAMAHNLNSGLRAAGFDIVFLPFWNYADAELLQLLSNMVFRDEFQLIVCFLGDSFSTPLPQYLVDYIENCHKGGTALLLFPFLAWSINRGLYPSLCEIVPARVQDLATPAFDLTAENVVGAYRRGDFKWLLDFDSFAEDQYIEIDPADGSPPFTDGIDSRFGLSHSFEYLTATKQAQVAWTDTAENPLVVIDESASGKVCYLNTCCHSCMSAVAVSSPLEAIPQASLLLRNIIQWLLK